MIACDQAAQWLSDELAGTLDPKHAEALESHLESCGSCRALAMDLLREDRALRELAARPQVEIVARRIHASLRGTKSTARRWIGGSIAAAAVLVAVLAMLLKGGDAPRPQEPKLQAIHPMPKDPVKAEAVRQAQQEKSRIEAERRRADQRLAEIERERLKLEEDRARAVAEQKVEDQRRVAEELARKEAQRKDAEAAREKLKAEERRAEEDVVRAKRAPTPAPGNTVAAIASLEIAEGNVQLLAGGGKSPARQELHVTAGQGIETGGRGSWAVVRFPDGTWVELSAETVVQEFSPRRIVVAKGRVTANVKKQPEGAPLVFATAQAEAKVLGTTLRLTVDPSGKGLTRLDVKEGKVQLSRLTDGKTIDVQSSQFAVAAAGVELAAKRSPRVVGDLDVPAAGWSTLKPNPAVAAMPDNTWMLLSTNHVPRGAVSFGDDRFGEDPDLKLGHPKAAAGLVYDEARNVTVYFGGHGNGGTNQTLLLSVSDATWYQAQADHFESVKDEVRQVTDRPLAQAEYGACYDPVEKIYLKGIGLATGGPSDSKLWSYDPGKNRWDAMAGWDTGPAYEGTGTLGAYRLAYDRAHGVAVVFGGLPVENRETWFFEVRGRRWRKANAGFAAPPGRYHAHMVYDERSRKTVLFGGIAGGVETPILLDDTWVFDAGSRAWTEMKPKARPPARWLGAMAYDAANGVCILVGGRTAGREDQRIDDTWAYDLTRNEWREMKPAGQPAGGSLAQAAYDRINNVTIHVTESGDTWLYRYKGKKP